MSKVKKSSIPITTKDDVAYARNKVWEVAQRMGFDALTCSQVKLGISELVQNILDHAQDGMVTIRTKNDNKVLQVIVADEGRGIPNLTAAMQDGYTRQENSLGIGLGVAERAFDRFDLASDSGRGTQVIVEKYLPLSPGEIQYGQVGIKDQRYPVNGDIIYTREYNGDSILAAIIDGAGQGHEAYDMASVCKSIIDEQFYRPLDELIQLCDIALSNSKYATGVAMSLVRITPSSISYVGVGDTHAHYIKDNTVSQFTQIDARVGIDMTYKVGVKKYESHPPFQIVLCTDGVQENIDFSPYDMTKSPERVAAHIFNKHHRPYGDASVLVIHYFGHEK